MQCALDHKADLERLYDKSGEPYCMQLGGCRSRICKRDRQSRQGQWQTALKAFQQALAKAQADNNRVGQVNALKSIGLVHCQLGEYAWGIKCLEQALQLAKAIGNRMNIAVILNYMGAAYRQTGQNQRALRVYLQALAIFKQTGNEASIARIVNRLGEIYNSLGQSERSLWYSRQALKMFQDIGNVPDGEGAALHNLGEAYCQLGRHRPALALFEQALAIRQKLRNRYSEATTLESIGTAYVNLNQELQGLEFYQQALEIRRRFAESPSAEARCLDYIGAVHYKLGNYAFALWHHLQALRILQALHHTASSVTLLRDTADRERFLQPLLGVYDRLGLHTQGAKCYEQALEIVKTFGDNPSDEAIHHYFEADSSQLN
jgi:tetratricopeptide (TPR) repeat protein